MKFTFLVEVEVDRIEGKFVSRDEIAEVLMDEITAADPVAMAVGAGSEYETTSFEVSEQPQERKRK